MWLFVLLFACGFYGLLFVTQICLALVYEADTERIQEDGLEL